MSNFRIKKLKSELEEKGYFVAVLDGSECKNLHSFLDTMSKVFKFPDYYGENINAFYDCIHDLGWISETNYALIIHNKNFFLSKETLDEKKFTYNLLERITQEWQNVPNYEGEDIYRNKADFKVIFID